VPSKTFFSGLLEKECLEALTDAGSAAAHRGWEPDLEQIAYLVSIMENFVRRILLKDEANKLKKAVPPPRAPRATEPLRGASNLIEFPSSKSPPSLQESDATMGD